jgi:peptidoglycan/LPS O-acetylase OafA/YrhL
MMVLGRTSEGFLSNTAMALIGAWLLYNSNFERSPLAFLDRAPLRHLGRVSYGFYLYHLLIGRQIARYLEPVSPEVFAMVAGSLTLLAATVSWYWFERPLNRLGHQLFSIRHVQESRSLESNILCWKSEAHPHELDVRSRQLVVRIGGEQ